MKKSIKQAINEKLPNGVLFRPSKELYLKTGLKPKRFGMIYQGKISPDLEEIRAIVAFFKLNVNDLI